MFLNCDETLTNAECRFILLTDVPESRPAWSISLMIIMLIIEIVAIIAGIFMTTLSIFVMAKQSTIHPNFSRIIITFALNFYELAASRIVLMLFQTKVMDLKDSSSYPILLVSSIAHVHELANAMCLYIAVIVERFFATIYIADYETKHRSYISIFLIGGEVPMSLIAAISISIGIVINVWLTLLIVIVCVSMMIAAGIILAILVYRRNKMLVQIAKTTTTYSLSTKFQLAENFRVFRALFIVAAFFAAVSSFGSASYQLHLYFLDKDENISSLFSELFDLHHTVCNPCIVVMFVLSQPAWRDEFKLRIRRCLPFKRAPNVHKVKPRADPTEVYFNDLVGSWDTQLAVVTNK